MSVSRLELLAQGNLTEQGHRGTAYVWEDAEADRAEQEALDGK